MSHSDTDNVLALAAIMQAVSLVDHLAFTGKIKNKNCFKASLNSLITANQSSVLDIYSSTDNLEVGIANLQHYCSPQGADDAAFTNKIKYLNQLNSLGKMVNKDASLARSIGESLSPDKVANHKKTSSALEKYLAQVYYDNFSSLPAKRRIIVVGKKEYLREARNIDMIRALLFAGVRATLLWRNYGGSMLYLFTRRKKMFRQLSDIVSQSANLSANA